MSPLRTVSCALVVLVACGKPELEAGPPKVVVTTLEDARTHIPYTAWLDASGGTPPLLWEVDGTLPDGLALNPAGAITGVPTQKQSTTFTLTVTDADGRSDSADLALDVKWAKGAVACGETRDGEFEDAAHLGFYDIDWDAQKGWTALEIPLPPPEVSTVAVEITGATYFPVYIALPGTPEGDQDLERNYFVNYAFPGYPVLIDLGSYPDLPSYRAYGEPIQLVIGAEQPGPWAASTTCTEGPVIQSVTQNPSRLGEPLTVNYSIYGEQGSVTWTLNGSLPPWATFDPASARITGIGEETGTWEYTLTATDEAGQIDTLQSGFGVYEHVPLGCDEPYTWTPTEGYYEGFANAQADPDGYRVFELVVAPEVSEVVATLESPDGGYVGLVSPGDETWSRSTQVGDFSPGTYEVAASPSSTLPIMAVQQAGVLHAVAHENYAGTDPVQFTFVCTLAPQLALPALPVVELGGAEVFELPVVGGTPPYSFDAVGLPAEIGLSPDGLLSTTAPAAGSWTVDVTITDALLDQSQRTWELYAGDTAACQGETMLSCGDGVSGAQVGLSGRDSYCLNPRIAEQNALIAVTLELQSGGLLDGFAVPAGGDPGNGGTWILAPRGPSSSGWVFDEVRTPLLSTYRDLPLFLDLTGDNGTAYDLAVDCF